MDLDLTLLKRQRPSIYTLLATIGGSIVVIYLLGHILVGCLTNNAYEDHLVQTVYPTKAVLKKRVKYHIEAMHEKDQAKFSKVLELMKKEEESDKTDPNLDISQHGCCRCICRCLFSRSLCCRLLRGCWRKICCKQSHTEQLFDIARDFYRNELSVARLVNAMQTIELQADVKQNESESQTDSQKHNLSNLERTMAPQLLSN